MSDTDKETWSEKLGFLLKYDTWNWELGLQTLVGIDGESSSYSDTFNTSRYLEPGLDRYAFENYETVSLLREGNREALPAIDNPDKSDIGHALTKMVSGDFLRQLDDDEDSALRQNVGFKLISRSVAVKTLIRYRDLFFSDPEHTEYAAFPPRYFINWALSKGLGIDWIDWVKARGLFEDQEISESADPEMDKRERDTLDTLVGALLFALKIDPSGHGTIKKVEGITEDYGAPIRKTALSKILKRIPTAKESVQDRKSR